MSPRHSNPTSGSRQAKAPYNFIPLPETMVKAQPPLDQNLYQGLTGWIDCELETCSPTYIRGMLTESQYQAIGEKAPDELTAEEKLLRAPFFSSSEATLEGYPVPVLPGSSLRGMIRNLVEILGHGRMRWVANAPAFTFRAVAASKDDPLRQPYQEALGNYGGLVNAGYLEKKGEFWSIRPAQIPAFLKQTKNSPYLKIKEQQIQPGAIPGYVRLNSSQYRPQYYPISFDAEIRRNTKGPYTAITRIGTREAGYAYRGTLVCSGNMLETNREGKTNRKNHTIIPEPDPKAIPLKISPQVIQDYLTGLTGFQKEQLWGPDQQGCLKDGAPVFFVAKGQDVLYFGHCPNFRVPARLPGMDHVATPRDFVPPELMNAPQPDLADAIFGWVEEAGIGLPEARAGRVYFQDARFVSAREGVWFNPKPIIPKTLGGPKTTTFQHYLVQDREKGHDPDEKARLAHYGSSPARTQIRGYKLYWHKGAKPEIEATPKELQHETQLTRIVPLKAGVKFSFRVRFENLREEELGALLWALALPVEDGQRYCHKLGMGKPLGMGAVKITPALHLSDRPKRYARLFDGEQQWSEPQTPQESAPYLEKFEAFVLAQIQPGKTGLRFSELERIKMLRAMLQWREGTPEWIEATRYMEIEYGADKLNEYKERPVLPDPLGVAAKYEQKKAPGTPAPAPAPSVPTTSATHTGTVKLFFEDKGYGFITQEDNTSIFVHRTGIESPDTTLRPEQKVTYRIEQGKKGPEARKVRPI